MAVYVEFACSGCTAKASGIRLLRANESVQDVAPVGWRAYDPWTWVTYCPSCWTEILNKPPARGPEREETP